MKDTDEQFAELTNNCSDALLNWAFVFRNALTAAAESMEADPSLDNQLDATIELITELIVLADGLPLPDEPMDPIDVVPLQRLLLAAVEIRNGHPHPLFDPSRASKRFKFKGNASETTIVRRPGRRKSNLRTQMMRAHAVAFVQLLREAGMEVGAAEVLVAKTFTEAGLRGSKAGYISNRTVHTWVVSATRHGDRQDEGRLAEDYRLLWRKRSGGSLNTDQIFGWVTSQARELEKIIKGGL